MEHIHACMCQAKQPHLHKILESSTFDDESIGGADDPGVRTVPHQIHLARIFSDLQHGDREQIAFRQHAEQALEERTDLHTPLRCREFALGMFIRTQDGFLRNVMGAMQ